MMETPKLAGVMGWPVGHSLSPRLHNWWLNHYHIKGHYVPLAVQPSQLADALRALPLLGFAGCNLTLPHKEMAVSLVDRLGPTAERIRSVNTVVVEADNSLTGHSTDGVGFRQALTAVVPDFSAQQALVLGAGGASRAIVDILNNMRVNVILTNRTLERAEILGRELNAKVVPWERRNGPLATADLIVNTTSLGLAGQPPLLLDYAKLKPGAVVYDIVYNPLETEFLRQGKLHGARTVSGIDMLLHQAVPGFTSWFGRVPEVTPALRAHVLKGLA